MQAREPVCGIAKPCILSAEQTSRAYGSFCGCRQCRRGFRQQASTKRNQAMKYRKLGDSGVDVSLIGLGTMTWGEQNTESEAHEQIDHALAQGVNLIDAAEMYPVPPRPETQGRTEEYIGTWLAKNAGKRGDIVLATKIAGPARQPHNPRHIRGAGNQFDRKNINEAIDSSLKRLQTDYVDLYQLHWPDRSTMTFG